MYGISAPDRRKLLRGVTLHNFAEYESIIRDLWSSPIRDEQYLAIDIATKFKGFRTLEAWPLYIEMVETTSWWDLLDPVAIGLVGELALHEKDTVEEQLVIWRTHDSMWARRASILAHLKHKSETNLELLEETIVALIDEREFFVRKAIGWVLRDYSRTDPDWVRGFVRKHKTRLSSLSQREALKHLGSDTMPTKRTRLKGDPSLDDMVSMVVDSVAAIPGDEVTRTAIGTHLKSVYQIQSPSLLTKALQEAQKRNLVKKTGRRYRLTRNGKED